MQTVHTTTRGGSETLQRLVLALCVAIAGLAFTPSALADTGDSATGSGHTVTPSGHIGAEFSFTATGGPNNSATGTMRVIGGADAFPETSATVNCLVVSGKSATIRGTITASTTPSLIGHELVFFVTDNGPPGAGIDLFDWATDVPCAATPPRGNDLNDGQITVIEATAEQKLANLIAELQSSPVGAGGSYLAKLQSIAASLGNGNTQAACSQLAAFENEVRAQTGKKLTQGEAADLLAATASIKTSAGCA